MENINVTRALLPDFDEYCTEIKSIWENHWLTNMGEKHKRLQEELKNYLEADNVVLFTNGHLALENIIAAFDFPKGAEVITTPFTFASTTHAIVRNGLKPVFCDINPYDYTIDTNRIEELITNKTVAIVPVHVYGNVCDVERIDEIAKKYKLKVIYDAAHAFGVRYKDRAVSMFGDASIYSFHATKVFNTIEGGAVCFRDNALVQKLNDMKNFGIHGPEDVEYVGGNAKMNEFQAAMGICNLRHINDEINKRKAIVTLYLERLKTIKGINLLRYKSEIDYNYAYFPVVFDNYKYTRNEIHYRLKQNGIYSRKYFYPLTNSYKCYSEYSFGKSNKTDIAEFVADRVLTLPLYGELSMTDVNRICDIILD